MRNQCSNSLGGSEKTDKFFWFAFCFVPFFQINLMSLITNVGESRGKNLLIFKEKMVEEDGDFKLR